MKITINEGEINILGQLIGSSIRKTDTNDIARGLTHCKNHKVGMELIKNISRYHTDTELSNVEEDTIEMELYKEIQKADDENLSKREIKEKEIREEQEIEFFKKINKLEKENKKMKKFLKKEKLYKKYRKKNK